MTQEETRELMDDILIVREHMPGLAIIIIEHEMNVTIAAQRDQWIEAFLQRIQARGYNVHFNLLRKIKPEEIPKRPKRKFKVVF